MHVRTPLTALVLGVFTLAARVSSEVSEPAHDTVNCLAQEQLAWLAWAAALARTAAASLGYPFGGGSSAG